MIHLSETFGGVRQSLNQYLGQQRALHMQRRHLALFLAELGYGAASRRQIRAIPVASVRMLTDMHVLLSTGEMLVDQGNLDRAVRHLKETEDLLKRSIHCGALVDPWNVLGFQGQYPRFQALEDSIHDHRVDDLTYIVDAIFNLYARLLREGAARGQFSVDADLAKGLRKLAEWWDLFATTTVADIPPVHGAEAVKSAEHVAKALAQWRERGAAASDLGFWNKHLDRFHSAKAFALVVEALLERSDFRASTALLMTWLSHAEEVTLEEGDFSFHSLALRWMLALCPNENEPIVPGHLDLAIKFFDYLEANADEYWEIPKFDLAGLDSEDGEGEDEDMGEDLGDEKLNDDDPELAPQNPPLPTGDRTPATGFERQRLLDHRPHRGAVQPLGISRRFGHDSRQRHPVATATEHRAEQGEGSLEILTLLESYRVGQGAVGPHRGKPHLEPRTRRQRVGKHDGFCRIATALAFVAFSRPVAQRPPDVDQPLGQSNAHCGA